MKKHTITLEALRASFESSAQARHAVPHAVTARLDRARAGARRQSASGFANQQMPPRAVAAV